MSGTSKKTAKTGRLPDQPVKPNPADKTLHDSEEKFRNLAASSFDAVIVLDHAGLVTLWNEAAATMFGYTAVEMLGMNMHERITSIAEREVFQAAYAHFKVTGECPVLNAHIEAVGLKKGGGKFPIEISVTPFLLQGKWHASAVIRDKKVDAELKNTQETLQAQIAEIHALQATLREQATRDTLTGLYARHYLYETLERELARASRENYPISVLVLDIDRFKDVNEVHGRQAGDEVLKALGNLLKNSVRQGDIACRHDGGEFVVIMPKINADDTQHRADALHRNLDALRVNYNGAELSVTVSIGVAFYPQHGNNMNEVLKSAEAALYAAKQAGRDCVRVW